MNWTPLQRRALQAMGYALVATRIRPTGGGGIALGEQALPPRLRSGLERWVGGQWAEWAAPAGGPGDAAFKRALWRRVRDWRRGR